MDNVVTLEQRKMNALKLMSDRLTKLKLYLSSYAAKNEGSYLLFGSASRGDYTEYSDVDIVVYFNIEKEDEAWRFAEESCVKLKLKPDVRSIRFCNESFIKKIMEDAVILDVKFKMD